MHGNGTVIKGIRENMEYQELADDLNRYREIYIYGAGVIAYGAYVALRDLLGIKVSAFLVTDRGNQLEQIDGIPVKTFGESQIASSYFIVIATPEEYHENIEQLLLQNGNLNYLKLDSHIEYVLMGRYFKEICNANLIEDYETFDFDHMASVGIYMAVSHMDRKLKTIYREVPWIKKIQVGAVLTKKRITELTDENCNAFSEKNALYGELSATYYAWKNGIYDVTGIFHYRRVLSVTREQLGLLVNKEIEVILPLPFVCYPDASGQYGRYLSETDVKVMLDVLKEKELDHFERFRELLKKSYLYNYNMLIARKEVFDDYCGWIFPLLEEITDRCERKKCNRSPRYIGRIGEILTSLYFMRNERKWKIVHAEKIWRV